MLAADNVGEANLAASLWYLYRVLKLLIEQDHARAAGAGDNVLYDPAREPDVELSFGAFVEGEQDPHHRRRIATRYDPLPDDWHEVRRAVTAASGSQDEKGEKSWYHPQYGPIEAWDVSNVGDMRRAFMDAVDFDRDLSGWDVSNVVGMTDMFRGRPVFTGRGLECWDVSSVTSTMRMFSGAVDFNGDLSGWDVSNVVHAGRMFEGAASFTGEGLSKWRTTAALWWTDQMFDGAAEFDANLAYWDVSEVRDMDAMFRNARKFQGDGLGLWRPANAMSTIEMFRGAVSFDADLSNWVTPVLGSNYNRMFLGASSFGKGKDHDGRRARLPYRLQRQATDRQLGWPRDPPAAS